MQTENTKEGKVIIWYRIGMFSKIGKTTIKALRYYDEVGLLAPEHVDEETGCRYYTAGADAQFPLCVSPCLLFLTPVIILSVQFRPLSEAFPDAVSRATLRSPNMVSSNPR